MSGRISRRSFLRAVALGGGLGAVSAGSAAAFPFDIDPLRPLMFSSPPLEPYRDRLLILPTVSGTSVDVHARSTVHQFHTDLAPSPALAYSGSDYLGATIEAHVGQPTTIAYRNTIAAHPFAVDVDTSLHGMSERDRTAVPTAMHLHGGVNPPEFDGHPEQVFRPGQEFAHHLPNRQEAAGLWYHDHAMGMTRLNIYAGLVGLYLLRDDFDTGRPDNPLGLPAGEFEVPLVLQEKMFTAEGRQRIRSTPTVPQGSWEGGAVGDVGVVNGKVWPELDVARGFHRLRLVNVGSLSVWNLYFGNRMRFWVIGGDNGLLDAPVAVSRVRLSPAERVDLLVDFGGLEPGSTVELCNDEPPPFQAALIGERTMPRFCRFRVGAARGFTGGPPATLRGGPGQPEPLPPIPRPDVYRDVTLSQPSDVRLPPSIMSLNNLRYSTEDIELPRQGTVEQWNIINATNDPHPVHLHLANFRVLGRQVIETVRFALATPQPPLGIRWTPSADAFTISPLVPAEPWERGFKDTVLANANSITRIVAAFPTAEGLGFDPDAVFGHGSHAAHGHASDGTHPLQGYVWHCHILDHEDHEMMLRYRAVV